MFELRAKINLIVALAKIRLEMKNCQPKIKKGSHGAAPLKKLLIWVRT
jgi:hypothetical protein